MLNFLHRYRIHALVASFFVVGLFSVAITNTADFRASVLQNKQAPAYDGLTLPVQKAPNWVAMNSNEWKLPYEQIPEDKLLPLPVYNPEELKMPKDSLGWKSDEDKRIRNAKITFSTPYMGNYKLDGVEYAGSHLAIDIKVPMNTPVYAIGNGTVVKAAYQASGFGHHIVVKHENFPSFNDPNVKTTYYSSYSHLSSILVKEGDVVLKGQHIALSGQTGLASTPHVHFQIDNDHAPWHPYWPFSYKEATDAGYNFVTAIDSGFGQERGIATTVNPMLYIQKYLDAAGNLHGSALPSQSDVSTNQQNTSQTSSTENSTQNPVAQPSNQENSTPVSTPPLVQIQEQSNNGDHGGDQEEKENLESDDDVPTAVDPVQPQTSSNEGEESEESEVEETVQIAKFKLQVEPTFVVGERKKFVIIAVDEQNRAVKNYKPQNGLSVQLLLGGARFDKDFLTADDFVNGKANNFFTPTSNQGLRFKVTDGVISAETEILKNTIFTDISPEDSSYNAIRFLKDFQVLSGNPDGSFHPDDTLIRAEAVKIIMKAAAHNDLQNWSNVKLPFTDVDKEAWYRDHVGTAFSQGLIAGYSDFTFRPLQQVTKAEFAKMTLKALNIEVSPNVPTDVAADVKSDDWYAPYIKYLFDKKVAESGNFFYPNTGITRKEAADLLYRLITLKLTGSDEYNPYLAPSTAKAEEFFAVEL